jgi:RNA polymerase subunit RPABC4/transcription elongation factor Spt4
MVICPECSCDKYFIKNEDMFIVTDKDNSELYKKSIMLFLNTQQAIEIRDYLNSQIDEHPEKDVAVGLLIHTGLNGKAVKNE